MESMVIPPAQDPPAARVTISLRTSVIFADWGIGTPVVIPSSDRVTPDWSVMPNGTGVLRLARQGIDNKGRRAIFLTRVDNNQLYHPLARRLSDRGLHLVKYLTGHLIPGSRLAPCRDRRALPGLLEGERQGFCEGENIADGHHETKLVGWYHFGNGADVGRNHWKTAAERLVYHVRPALTAAGKAKDVSRRHQFR